MIDVANEILKFENSNNYCYINEDNKITYKQLIAEAKGYSEILAKSGNTPVVVFGHKSVNMIITIISCILAKRCYVPVDTFTPKNRLQKIIKDTNVSIIINNSTIELENSIKLEDIGNMDLKSIVDKKYDNISYIIFTSGSTGEPKGALLKRDNLNNFVNYMINYNNEYKGTKVLNTASFSFDLSVADIYFTLCTGGTLYSLNHSNDLGKILDFIKENEIEYIVSTPTFARMLLLDKTFKEDFYQFIKCFYFCGEILKKDLVSKLHERFPKAKVINAYGPTEACCAVSMIDITDKYDDSLPVGTMSNIATKIEIVDNEIVLSGESIFYGYLNSTKSNGVYNTGDIGYIKNNLLYCVGRKDNQIKYKGYRIELSDIENNLKKCNGVVDAVVVAKRNNDTVKYIKGFVIFDTSKIAFDEERIKQNLKEFLPDYMIPKMIKRIDSIPFTSNNKIDRRTLEDD